MSEKNKKDTNEKKESSGKFLKWFKECKSEIKKVIWPNKKQVTNNTIAVIVMSLISMAFIAVLDVVFYQIIKLF